MTNYLMSDDSFMASSVYKPKLNYRIFLFIRDQKEAQELNEQISAFGYQVNLFSKSDELISALRWSLPIAILVFVDGKKLTLKDYEELAGKLKKQANHLPLIIISKEDNFDLRLKVVRAGGAAFFTHPVDISALIGSLDEFSNPPTSVPMRILIVDDVLSQASFYAMHLEKVGMHTRIVTDPRQMIQPMIEFNPDLILLDMYLPECNGIELARMIRQMENFVSVPIVFLSAESDRERQLAALMMGADDFLIKPVKPEHLIASLTSRIERYRKLRSLMIYDGLTNLLNHTTIKERLVKELIRSEREKQPLSFAMIDLDHFKKVNDQYGHSAGDRVLKSLARLLKQRLRRTDLIGRYGGEEFSIIFPNTNAAEAASVVDKLRESFARLHHLSPDGVFTVTFSCGIASFPQFKTAVEISNAADKALYQAKEGGRNRVSVI
ncbi:MAG: diguanylate cyclase [Chloroflexota bacterium]